MYSSSTGYTARAFRLDGTAVLTNGYAAQELHANATRTTKLRNNFVLFTWHTSALTSRGNKQYPKTLKLWKKMILPPRSCTFRVSTMAPADSVAKTTANTFDLFSVAEYDSVKARNMMKKKGPHRSQSLNALPGSSRYGFGSTTSFRLVATRNKSLFRVSLTGSVKVLYWGPPPNPAPVEGVGPDCTGVENAWLLLETNEGGNRGAETGILGGLDGFRAGGTDRGTSRAAGCTLMWNKLSISSISDCDDVLWSILFMPDIVKRNSLKPIRQRE